MWYIFRDIVCEVYALCRAELDTYLAIISDMAMTYGGTLSYDYHMSLFAKTANCVLGLNQRMDWSVVGSHT